MSLKNGYLESAFLSKNNLQGCDRENNSNENEIVYTKPPFSRFLTVSDKPAVLNDIMITRLILN